MTQDEGRRTQEEQSPNDEKITSQWFFTWSFVIPSSFHIRISAFLLLRSGGGHRLEYANYNRIILDGNATSRSIRHSKLRAGLFLLHRRIHFDLAHLRRQRQYFEFH